jgi:hypothetical protein
MRWADSDSSDEEAAYIPPSKSDAAPPPHQQDDIQPSKQPVKVQPQPAPPKTSLQALTVGGQGEPRRNNHTGTRGRGRGGRSADVRPGGNRGDWKQMAKDQSQLKPKRKKICFASSFESFSVGYCITSLILRICTSFSWE